MRLTLEETDFGLGELVEDLVTLLEQGRRQPRVAIRLEIDPGIPRRLVGDPLRLEQILINLIDNALKFTDQGEVLVRIRLLDKIDGRLRLGLDVEDSGPGIPESAIATLFEPFRQADSSITRKHGGSGLGLAITERLVKLMDGSIEVESRLGEGSVFRVDLWLTEDGPAARMRVDEGETPALAQARQAMRTAAGSRGAVTARSAGTPLSPAARQRLKELRTLAADHDPTAEEFFDAHKPTLAEHLSSEQLERLQGEIQSYQFTDAIRTLDALLSMRTS